MSMPKLWLCRVCLAVGIVLVLVDGRGARADDAALVAGPAPVKTLFFSGADGWQDGASVHAGGLWSPQGLDADGFTLKFISGLGAYRYRSGALGGRIQAFEAFDSVLPGWRLRWGKLEIAAFAGLDVQNRWLTPDDPTSRLRGFHAGLRAGVDLWYEPSEALMLAASGWATTVGSGYWTRAAAGWRVLDLAWIGPELQALGDADYRQLRAGAHVTGFHTGAWEWSASAGFARDQDRHNGFYGRIGVLTRR